MGDSDSAGHVAVETDSAESASSRAIEAPTSADAAPASAAALLRTGAGGPSLARQVLALQRAAGNAATGRLLLRDPTATVDRTQYRVVPPRGTAAEIAAWTRNRIGAVEGRDVVAVLTSSQILIFNAEPSPKLLDVAARSSKDDDYQLFTSVWCWTN